MGSTSKAVHLENRAQTAGDDCRRGTRRPGEPKCALRSLLGGRRLLEVPQLEGVVLGGGDQDGLHRVEGQTPHRVEVAPQGELWVPGLPQSVRVVGDLRDGSHVVTVPTELQTDGGGGGEDSGKSFLNCEQ